VTEAVIEARGLCNRFGSQSVHENLDLDLYRGEILAVVGGSGSGKSVLLRSIVGLRRPNEGTVKVFGLAGVKLALAGLPISAADKYPASLSGGMIKRAALARALALDPDILFLDEPTAGLDPIGAAAFDQLILTLRDALGLSVFLITHDLDTLYTITDRVAVLSQKKVLVAGPLAEVEQTEDPWIHEYFHGPRGRAAEDAALRARQER